MKFAANSSLKEHHFFFTHSVKSKNGDKGFKIRFYIGIKSKNGDKGFKIGHLNIRSLIKNIDQLKIYLSNHQYDIICINETWLDDKINTYEVSWDGYDLVRKDRKRTGGGVGMYIRNSISYKVREDIMPEGLETITVEINKPRAKPFFLNT